MRGIHQSEFELKNSFSRVWAKWPNWVLKWSKNIEDFGKSKLSLKPGLVFLLIVVCIHFYNIWKKGKCWYKYAPREGIHQRWRQGCSFSECIYPKRQGLMVSQQGSFRDTGALLEIMLLRFVWKCEMREKTCLFLLIPTLLWYPKWKILDAYQNSFRWVYVVSSTSSRLYFTM